ncbi:MAG: anaerobic ribonucleoside-triphosphate reductase activating protein [Rickettsiaceae bacterium]|nr:anaerobic ribonucleoside-triphosphate reductase activating protein [Rickettsiaceae bacterium]
MSSEGAKFVIKLPICDITPFTLQDFPNHVACILWFSGCNMRCIYCYNSELVFSKRKNLVLDDITQFLQKRVGIIEGVVLSGGECTLSPKLPEFIKYVRELGYKVKLDTNGLNPDMLESLINKSQLNYVALDYKAPPKKFYAITRTKKFSYFKRSLKLLCESNIPFEVRTTVHTDLINEQDIEDILTDLERSNFKGNYYLQNFRQSTEIVAPLQDQTRKLDLNLIHFPKSFKMFTRNF